MLLLLRCLHNTDLSCRWTCLHWRGLSWYLRCLHHSKGAWAASGRVWRAAYGLMYTTEACAALGPVHTLGPGLNLACLHYRVLCCTWTCFLYRDLTCTWTCLDNSNLCCSWTYLQYTTEACTAHWRAYTVDACAAREVFYTTQYREMSCTWRCLNNSSLCCFCWGVYTTRTWAADGHVYTGEACAAPWGVYTTAKGLELHLDVSGVWTPVASAAPGLMYTT